MAGLHLSDCHLIPKPHTRAHAASRPSPFGQAELSLPFLGGQKWNSSRRKSKRPCHPSTRRRTSPIQSPSSSSLTHAAGIRSNRAAYRLAQKRKLIRQVPYFPFFRADNRRTGFFETDQVERLLRELPAPIADATEFAYLSGWRKGEILPLRWEAVDRAAREVCLVDSKSGDRRTLPLEGAFWVLIEKRWGERQFQRGSLTELSALVFHDRGKPLGDFRKSWAAACKRAGVAGRIFHDLRRSAVRNMIRGGTPQSVAMSITGHRTISMFLRYGITSENEKRKALRDTETFIRLDRAEREALNAQEKLGPTDDSPAAKKRTKRRTKSKRG